MNIELYLLELSRIVKAFAPKTSRVLDRRRLENSKLGWAGLFKGFVDGSIVTERTGKKVLSAQGGSTSSYAVQRSYLKDRLINTLFILDLKQQPTSPVLRAKYQCQRRLFLTHVMLMFGMRKFGIEMAKRALAIAEEWNFTLIHIDLVSLLRTHASLLGSRRDHEYYKHEHLRLMQLYEAESFATAEYEKVNLLFARSASEKPQLAPQFEEAAERVASLARRFTSFELDLASARLGMAAKQIALKFEQTLERCDEACIMLEQKWPAHFDTFRLAEINLMRLICAAHLRELPLASTLKRECEATYRTGSPNWFVLQENYILTLVHCFEFITAKATLDLVVKSDQFASQPEHLQHRWRLYELFLSFTDHQELIRIDDSVLKELHDLQSDKAGYKVCVLVLQVLSLVRARRFDEIEEMLEPLHSYRLRHFKKRDPGSGAAILDIIHLMSVHQFEKLETEKAVSAIVPNLKSPIRFLHRNDGFVTLPFDWIWQEMRMCLIEHDQDGILLFDSVSGNSVS